MAFISPYTATVAVGLFLYFLVWPVVHYYRDPKGLRRFPNMSIFSGISALPMMKLAHGGARSTVLTKMHKEKPVIRIAPNMLSFGDVRAIKEIYGHNTPCLKDQSYILFSGTHFHLADVIDRGDHGRKRKVLSSAYALKNLEEWEHKVADKMIRLMKHIDTCLTDPLPATQRVPLKEDVNLMLRSWVNFFTLDAISDIGLSEPLGFLDQGHSRTIARRTDGTKYETDMRDCLYQNATKQSLLIWSYDWYPFINKISNLIPYYGRMGKFAQEYEGIPLELTTRRWERYQKGEKLGDFFQALMENKSSQPNNLEWGEIVAEMSIMLNAGSVTTAIAITNVIYLLLKNPNCLAKLRAELDSVLDDNDAELPREEEGAFYDGDGVIAYDRLKHLPYLRACLDESLRLFPPTVHGQPRVTPPGGITIADHHVAAGVTVLMAPHTAHRDAGVFPDGESFVPERWLGEAGKALQPYFISFSAGPRGCIGRNISYLEQTVAVGTLLRKYEFALPHPEWKMPRRETLNWILGEMQVKVWRRQRGKRAGGGSGRCYVDDQGASL